MKIGDIVSVVPMWYKSKLLTMQIGGQYKAVVVKVVSGREMYRVWFYRNGSINVTWVRKEGSNAFIVKL